MVSFTKKRSGLSVSPGQELIDFGVGMAIDDAVEDVGQVGQWFDIIEFGGFDERGDDAPVASPRVMAGEERILAVEGDGSDRAFDAVVVDLDAAVLQEAFEALHVAGDVAQGLAQAGAGGDAGALDIEPIPEGFDQGRGPLPANPLAFLGRVAADLRLDGIEPGDLLQALFGDGGGTGAGNVGELAPGMSPAIGERQRTARPVGAGQPIVGGIAIHLQDAAIVLISTEN